MFDLSNAGAVDEAQSADEPLGGINLNRKVFEIDVQRDPNTLPLRFQEVPLPMMHIEGLDLMINFYRPLPAPELYLLLGLVHEEGELPNNEKTVAGTWLERIAKRMRYRSSQFGREAYCCTEVPS